MVAERRREVGFRMALGADRASVLRIALAQGPRLTLVGVAIAGSGVQDDPGAGVAAVRGAAVGSGDGRVGGGEIGTVALLPPGACGDPASSDD